MPSELLKKKKKKSKYGREEPNKQARISKILMMKTIGFDCTSSASGHNKGVHDTLDLSK